jgi:hypothetical protein
LKLLVSGLFSWICVSNHVLASLPSGKYWKHR